MIGKMGYEAPEVRYYIEVDEEHNDKGQVCTNTIDIWLLGRVLYQIRARQLPLSMSRQLKRYCDGKGPSQTKPLIENTSAGGLEYLKNLLFPTRQLRPTAREALQAGWLRSEELSDIRPHQRKDNVLEPHGAGGKIIGLPGHDQYLNMWKR
jgi:hypothetical protein